jgi:4-amino-4-deoxychorismate lyase
VVDCKKPTVIVSINQWPQDIEQKQQGIDAYLCKHPLVVNPALAGIKHLNRLDQVIARNEWTDTAIYEGIMADNVGHLIEGCSSNLFAVRDGSLITAPASECAVAGVVRQAVIGWATQMNVPVDERKIKLSELNQLDAVFVCNSIWGILPLNKLHNAQTAMKQFSADAITLQMQKKFAFSRSTDAQTV